MGCQEMLPLGDDLLIKGKNKGNQEISLGKGTQPE